MKNLFFTLLILIPIINITYGQVIVDTLYYSRKDVDSIYWGKPIKVFVEFVVEKDGSVSNVKIVKGVGGKIDDRAMHAVMGTSGKWQQAINAGKPVRLKKILPVFVKEDLRNSPNINQDNVFTYVDEAEKFIGDIYEFLTSNLIYPKEAFEKRQEGKVYVQFIIEKDGTITNVKTVKGVGGTLDHEAERVIGLTSGQWIPGKHKGQIVRYKKTFPIIFKLPPQSDTITDTSSMEVVKYDANEKIENIDSSGNLPLTYVGEPEKFKGDLTQFFIKNLTYPEEAKRKKLEGKVYVQFIIEKDGSISDVHTVKGAGRPLDQEAERVISLTNGLWIPGKYQGKIVRLKKVVPMYFKLP